MGIVCGVGINDVKGAYKTWQYGLWSSMIERCYAANRSVRTPSYEGCTVSEYFLTLSNFIAWADKFDKPLKGWCLDKDILGNGKLYSEHTCCFVPNIINQVFTTHAPSELDLPKGVFLRSGSTKFRARRSMYGKRVALGTHDTKEQAHQAYVVATENYVHELAEEYKDLLAANVYETLKAYSI
jgi:hypothetical protein